MTNQSTDIKNFTRGGQITLHNIRMFIQIINKVVIIAGLIFLMSTIFIAYKIISPYERYVFGEYLIAGSYTLIDEQATVEFTQPNGSKNLVKYTDILNSVLIKNIVKTSARKILVSLIIGILISMFSLYLISCFLRKRGKVQMEDQPARGDVLASKEMTKKIIINKKMNSDLNLAGLPLIKNSEIKHFLFHGTTRSGKSTGIKELLDQIRRRGERALVYDKSCTLIKEFYRPTDILLNPLDVRGKNWGLWLECRDSVDFDNIAAALIPMTSTLDPFWIHAARTIFSSVAFQMRNDKDRSIVKLLRYLLSADLSLIQKYLKGTEAETLVSESIEKTAISIKSTLATYIKSLKYVNDSHDPFSIRQWIQNENSNEWLFFTSLGDRHETLKPLMSSWLDIAVNSLISLPENENRRIWIILDELYSLHKLPYLESFLSEAGKFGGCAVIGIQNYPQLEEVYNEKGARVISSLLNTRLFYREPDPYVAQWSSLNLGESISEEVRESISYGANTMRDGISINKVKKREPLVSFSEIMSLGDLNAYVRLPGQFPITTVDFTYKSREKNHAGFILRHNEDMNIKEVDELVDDAINAGVIISETKLKSTYEETKKKIKPEKTKTKQSKIDNQSFDIGL